MVVLAQTAFLKLLLSLWTAQSGKPLSKHSWYIALVYWWEWSSSSPSSWCPGPPKWRMPCPWEGMEILEGHNTMGGRNQEALYISFPRASCSLSVCTTEKELCEETWAAELAVSFCLCNYKWHRFPDWSTQLSKICFQMLLSFYKS